MSPAPAWPEAEPLRSARLFLEPLRIDHAGEAVTMLSDAGLYTFIGGKPPTAEELALTYARQVVGQSPDGSVGWLNWMLRHRTSAALVGTVQASIVRHGEALLAELAWVTAIGHQGHGYATEAARVVMTWLESQRIGTVQALIHPGHAASERVARRLGLSPTDELVDGETRWELHLRR